MTGAAGATADAGEAMHSGEASALKREKTSFRFRRTGTVNADAKVKECSPKLSKALERRQMMGLNSHIRVRRKMPPSDKPDIPWTPLFEEDNVSVENAPSWANVNQMNVKRRDLLNLARNTSPIGTVLRLSVLPRTVLPRLAGHLLLWLVLTVFAGTAVVARLDYGGDVSEAEAVVSGGGTLCVLSRTQRAPADP